mmetsp:Transcript_21233/g.31127  ORF Transcript_21233/g.31127 Transcript_21233/m.31127 type:complete len:181 (-) Transcript_21233:229-771(-)
MDMRAGSGREGGGEGDTAHQWMKWSEAFANAHSPKSLALLLALGVATGLFPLCGLEIAVGQMSLRMVGSVEPSFIEPAQTMWLNAALLLALNLAMLPFELLLITPFTTLGAHVMHASAPDITSKMWAYELLRHPKEMKVAMMHSCVGWALLLPFLVGGLFLVLVPVVRILTQKIFKVLKD